MDRRALLGKSKAELVMARVGQVLGLCLFLLLLPVLPILLAYVGAHKAVSKLTGRAAGRRRYEPRIGQGAS